ncbi:MAG: orotate phosphoribosyltransferase, partial [Candidatus Hydrogenedentes bacterium]|nr:orotate phosphoribosyltransferase [Candidatus Hydrogenedentota bacterium]
MTQEEVIQTFRDAGALLEGHFIYTSGRHGSQFLQASRVLQYPEHTEKLCKAVADRFRNDNIDLVVGPATGGIILAYATARHLGARAAFTEKSGDLMAIKRGI